MEKATFGGGCFWGVEEEFRRVKGVQRTAVGYTGGFVPDPNYFDVCTGTTGHAEAVELQFDPELVSYEQLLDVFWNAHDPTRFHRQGDDVGSQYRSAIFFHSVEPEAVARASKKRLEQSCRFTRAIVTEIVPATRLYRAEDYQQRCLAKHGVVSCRA
jgi:peptide-methionine (S)-S-oxide reductase